MGTIKSRYGIHIVYWLVIISIIALISYSIIYWIWFNRPFFDRPVPNITIAFFNLFFVKLFSCIPLLIFIKFIRNVKLGQTFTQGNIRLLSKLAIFTLTWCALILLNNWLFYIYIAQPNQWEVGSIFKTFHAVLIIFSIFIWLLSYVLSIGLDLQKDKELTI